MVKDDGPIMLQKSPMSENLIYHAYLPESSNQTGGDLPFFVGRQYGSGWLGTLARVAFPILKRIAGIASNAAEDVIYQNKPVKTAIIDHAMGAIGNLVRPSPTETSPPINTVNTQRKTKRKSSSYPLFQQTKRQRRK